MVHPHKLSFHSRPCLQGFWFGMSFHPSFRCPVSHTHTVIPFQPRPEELECQRTAHRLDLPYLHWNPQHVLNQSVHQGDRTIYWAFLCWMHWCSFFFHVLSILSLGFLFANLQVMFWPFLCSLGGSYEFCIAQARGIHEVCPENPSWASTIGGALRSWQEPLSGLGDHSGNDPETLDLREECILVLLSGSFCQFVFLTDSDQ